MRIIFLDIDGVLHTEQWIRKLHRDNVPFSCMDSSCFCPVALSNLQCILETVPDANIVISSTWRRYIALEDFNRWFWGRVIDVTKERVDIRGNEIDAWLSNKVPLVESFVIIDDGSDMGKYIDKLVKCDGRMGLMLDKAEQAIKILNGEVEEKNPFSEDVWSMIKECSDHSIPLNMNDTFGYACAESVECDFFDLTSVAYLYKKYGHDGVVAWSSIKESTCPIKPLVTAKFLEAKEEILGDPSKFYWCERYRKEKEKNV